MSSPQLQRGPAFALTLATIGAALLSTGCASTRMETARQLDHGEFVVGATIDVPGVLWIPRIGAHGMIGLGDVGDLSLYLGTAFITYNFGLGGRLYLGDMATLSVKGDLVGLQGLTPAEPYQVSVTPRLTTTTDGNRMFYAGVQGHAIFGESFASFFDADGVGPLNYNYTTLGFLVGVDVLTRTGIGVQFEFATSFFAVGPLADGAIFWPQTSLGFYYTTKDPEAPANAGPTPEYYSEPRQDRAAEPPRRDDERDVPIY